MSKVTLEKKSPPQATYQEAYEKAKADGRLTRKTSRIHTWKGESSVLIGKVKAIKPFTGGKFDKEVNSYLIETDDGLISTIMGSYTDTQLAEFDLIGKTIRIEYEGKKELEDDRKVNLFNVDILETEASNGS